MNTLYVLSVLCMYDIAAVWGFGVSVCVQACGCEAVGVGVAVGLVGGAGWGAGVLSASFTHAASRRSLQNATEAATNYLAKLAVYAGSCAMAAKLGAVAPLGLAKV